MSAKDVGSMLIAALALARDGVPCFPCRADKRPATPHGFNDATNDPGALRELWRRCPGELVGVPTGAISGCDVLDLDAKHETARQWWAAIRARLPATLTCRTRSHGLHLYFRHAEGLRCSAGRIAQGVDVRADGGYVIHWRSTRLPVLLNTLIAPWPDWLLALALGRSEPQPVRFAVSALGDRRLAGLVRAVAYATEGTRNSILYWASCRVREGVEAGGIAMDFGAAVLEEAAIRAGLAAIEARRTIASGLRSAIP